MFYTGNVTQKGNILIYLLVGLIVLIGVAGGAYYLGTKKSAPVIKACTKDSKTCWDGSLVNRVAPSCDFAPCPASTSASPIPDETANWKIYTNQKYGFSFKIPQDYLTEECLNGMAILISKTSQGVECQTEPSGLVLNISNKDDTAGQKSLIKRDYSITEKDINIDGILGTQLEGTLTANPAPLPNHVISSFFNRNNIFYQFNYVDHNDGAETNLYSRIISTFKFN